MKTIGFAVVLVLLTAGSFGEALAARVGACAADARRFCGGPVDSRLATCLTSHVDQLSPLCQKKVRKAIRTGVAHGHGRG